MSTRNHTAIKVKKSREEIAEKLGLTAEAVNKKITLLRTQLGLFCSQLIKPLPSRPSGCAAKICHQKWLVENLDFLKQRIKKRDSVCNTVSAVHK